MANYGVGPGGKPFLNEIEAWNDPARWAQSSLTTAIDHITDPVKKAEALQKNLSGMMDQSIHNAVTQTTADNNKGVNAINQQTADLAKTNSLNFNAPMPTAGIGVGASPNTPAPAGPSGSGIINFGDIAKKYGWR
jgi:hypothetical protein